MALVELAPPHSETDRSIMLQPVETAKRVVLEFEGLNARVPISPAIQSTEPKEEPASNTQAPKQSYSIKHLTSMGRAGQEGASRQILFDVDGVVEPGEVMALMGPSGSGKSSLLGALSGRTSAQISGSVLFNGQTLNKQMKRKLGYVMQDDLLFAELTVFETLYYAAMLRLPREWSKEDKMERVEMVLQGLGLAKCRDTIIGNHMMRGVSGGERKRVSIGHELLINPSVIFMDEPTSGLDSTTALRLVHTMRSLASGGRTIIASIHQPSSRLYQEMDKLMLLSEGHVMFYGDAHGAAGWFEQQGVPVPFGISIPDHLLDLACGELPGSSSAASQQVQQRLIDAFANRSIGGGRHGITASLFPSHVHKAHAAHSQLSTSQDGSSPADSQSEDITPHTKPGAGTEVVIAVGDEEHTHVKPGVAASAGGDVPLKEHKWGATWPAQVRILTSRCVRVRRTNALSWQRCAEVIAPALLSGLFWFQMGGSKLLSKQNVTDLSGLLFFQVLFMAFSSVYQALFAFPADFEILKKERHGGMYRLSAYYAARSISDIPMDCLVPTLYSWTIYWLSGLRLQAGAFIFNWLAVLLTVLVGQSKGLLISATVMNARTGMAMATVMMLSIMLVGGFYVKDMPAWIGWAKYLSFVYYAYNLVLKIEFAGRGYDCADYYKDNPTAPPGKTWCSIADGDFLPVNVNASTALDACVLIGMLVVIRVLVYVALQRTTTFKQKAA